MDYKIKGKRALVIGASKGLGAASAKLLAEEGVEVFAAARNIDKIKTGRAVYAFACNHGGGILMDGVLMHPSEDEFIYVQANGDFINWATANIGALDVKIEDFNSI